MEITRDRKAGTLELRQCKLSREVVTRYDMEDAKPKSQPFSTSTRYSMDEESEPLDQAQYPYAELVDSLMYLASCTRSDIAFAVGALARYTGAPKKCHWEAAKQVLRYLKSNMHLGLVCGERAGQVRVLYY
jgi:hypothetical protein